MRDIVWGDHIEQSGPNAVGKVVFEARPEPVPPPPPPPPLRTVLLLMSNPTNTQQLRLDEEHRAIDMAIVQARYRDRIDLRTGLAPRHSDLHSLLRRHRPTVVHYAGHGQIGGIALLDSDGRARVIAAAALEDLFAIVGASIRCVVLNACLTAGQARAIAAHVPCVVGMSGSVLDETAIEFAAAFYSALADGESVATAFKLGRNQLLLSGRDTGDLVLVAAPGVAERVFIMA